MNDIPSHDVLKAVQRIEILGLQPGDVLAVKVGRTTTAADAHQLKAAFEIAFAPNKVVLYADAELSVVRPEQP